MSAAPAPPEGALSHDAGWIAGAIVIAAVLLVGAAFWFMHHP
jgi:hypothetical protein